MDRIGGENMAADIKTLINLLVKKEKQIIELEKEIDEKKQNKNLSEIIEIIEGLVK